MDSLYSYRTIFIINSQSSLDDFWSFLIFRLNLEKSEGTYDRFARLYNFLCGFKKYITIDTPIFISLEESSSQYYLTIDTKIELFLKKFVQRMDSLKFNYIYKDGCLSYTIDKKEACKIVKPQIKHEEKRYQYDFIDPFDLDEMLNILEKMSSKNYDEIYDRLDDIEINDYRTTFSYYSSHLQFYPELIVINNIVAELSVILSLYINECKKLGNDFRILLQSFLNNLIHWQEKVFIKGSNKLDFMDESFQADLSQIKIALNLYDNQNNTLDDIFDF